MSYKQKFLALTMLFMILTSNFVTVLGVSGEASGDISGELPSGDFSEEPSDEPENKVLSSVAQSSSISTYKNTSITSTLRSVIDSGETDLKYVIETQPSHGTLLYEDTTSSTFTYTPASNFIGTDSFSFKLTNGLLYSNTAMVTITVTEKSEEIIPFNYIDMQDHWGNYSASHLAARGLIIGEQIGNRYYFKPNTLITRADFMLYLLAITESNTDANLEIPNVTFDDQKLYPDWLVESAKLAYAKGIIKGSTSGNKLYLNLYQNLTRAEASVMINNIIKGVGSTKSIDYADQSEIPVWAKDSVKALTAYKIIQGDGNYFRPNSVITKAEAGEMCYKLLKQLEADTWNSSSGDIK